MQPKRVRFTLKKLTEALRRIRKIRGPDSSGNVKLRFGKQLNSASFGEEKVLMEWIVEGSSTEFNLWAGTRYISKVAREFSDFAGLKEEEPARTKENKESMGWVSSNGAMITNGLKQDVLRRNIAWIQLRIIIEDAAAGYDTPFGWKIESDEETGMQAAWIDAGYSKDVTDLQKEIRTFERVVCANKRLNAVDISLFEWLSLIHISEPTRPY